MYRRLFKYLILNKKNEIFFDIRNDQYCIEEEKKIFHVQVDLWDNITKDYIDTIPMCNTKNKVVIGNIDQNDKINCPQCLDLLNFN
ncbi:hypothetical protein SAMN05444481_1413 [Flavobacterium frigidimaris]|nr:hypothetical protein SAMN05444481_1413 [Flavobacterium frigidimaris]